MSSGDASVSSGGVRSGVRGGLDWLALFISGDYGTMKWTLCVYEHKKVDIMDYAMECALKTACYLESVSARAQFPTGQRCSTRPLDGLKLPRKLDSATPPQCPLLLHTPTAALNECP